VALARALVFEPAVLLLDEPLSALDAKVRVGLREEIRRLQLQLGMTTLFVTHDQEEALSISDRVGVMSNGQIEQLGAPREVYGQPATPFVARFVGRINEFPGELGAEGVSVAGVRVGVPAPQHVPIGSGVIVMSRPEHLRVTRLNGDATGLAGTAVSDHFAGASSVLRIRLDVLDQLVDVQMNPDADPVAPGDRVQVRIVPDKAHVIAAS
jgi:putative spermidine/putrescine transport system ATP-binding protein